MIKYSTDRFSKSILLAYPQPNKSLHRNAISWSVELQRLSASGELGRYAMNGEAGVDRE